MLEMFLRKRKTRRGEKIMVFTPERTELQKRLGKIVRNTKIASWQKCEEIEELFANVEKQVLEEGQ